MAAAGIGVDQVGIHRVDRLASDRVCSSSHGKPRIAGRPNRRAVRVAGPTIFSV
jgi:hypothetical protein